MSYLSVFSPCTYEKVIERSRFIANCAHAESEEQARAFIAGIRAEHSLATHNCFAFVADKVVGRGAAALMILGGVKGVFARVISMPALEFFRTYGVDAAFATEVPHIINRQGTDWCPLEKRCIHAQTVEECREIIDRFVRELPRSAVKEKGSNA